MATGHSIFKGFAGGTPVYLVRSIHGWADSGGCDGGCPPLEPRLCLADPSLDTRIALMGGRNWSCPAVLVDARL